MSARWRYILQEALIGLRRNLWMTAAVVLSIAVSLALFGASMLLRAQVDLATDEWTGKIEVSIYLCDDATCPAITDAQRADLETQLNENPLVQTVYHESKEEAWERFQRLFQNEPQLVEATSPDALPESFRVKLKNPEQFAAIKAQYESLPGIEEIVDQRQYVNEVLLVARAVRWGALAIAIVQMLATILLVANTVRVAAFARRDQTQIMRLVGASNWYIRLPFVMEGIMAGVTGAAVAWVLLIGGVPWLIGLLPTLDFVPLIGLGQVLAVWPWLFVPAIIIAGMSSFIALWGFLDV